MTRIMTLLLTAVAGVAVLTRMPVAETAQLNRDLLWATVQVCVAAKRSVNLPVPCQAVDLGAADRPGTALLRVPGAATHHVLMPVGDFAGLESPQLQGKDGVALFQAALAARSVVAGAISPPHVASDIGLAINSPMSRSQDHLHIHLDCIRPTIRAALRAADVGDAWAWLPQAVGGRRYLARRVPAEAAPALNPFASIVSFLPERRLIRQTSLAAIPADGQDLYLVADIRPNSFGEALLDHACGG